MLFWIKRVLPKLTFENEVIFILEQTVYVGAILYSLLWDRLFCSNVRQFPCGDKALGYQASM